MKKKIIITVIIIILLLIIGVVCFFIFFNKKPATIITLDINPSVEIHLNEENKVIKVIPLNDDAKEVINDNLINMDYNEAINNILDKTIEIKELKYDRVDVIVNAKGKVTNDDMSRLLLDYSDEKKIDVAIIIPNEITEEDKALAKKYNITEAKANYINDILKKYDNIDVEKLLDRSIEELDETKNTGRTCPDGYTLKGEFCQKEKSRKPAITGLRCSNDYSEYNGKCYPDGKYTETDKLVCYDDFKLNGDKCEKTATHGTKGKCTEGKYDDNRMKCSIDEYYGDATLYCRITPGEDLLYGERCLGRKPTINGGCLGSDKVINGWCYDTSANSGYEAEYRCPDGALMSIKEGKERDGKCYKLTLKDPEEIYCEDGFTLEGGNKCVHYDIEDAWHERICETGYTLIKDGRCLNLNSPKEMENGLICDEPNTRLVGDICIIYEEFKANTQ